MVFAVGAVVMFVAELVLVRVGQPIVGLPVSLGVTLVLIGFVIPGLAWPVRQVTRGSASPDVTRTAAGVNPFYAMRVVLLAKAGSLTGAVLMGAGVGVGVFVLTRAVIIWPTVVSSAIATLGGVVLVVGSLLAEHWCQIPPTDSPEVVEKGERA